MNSKNSIQKLFCIWYLTLDRSLSIHILQLKSYLTGHDMKVAWCIPSYKIIKFLVCRRFFWWVEFFWVGRVFLWVDGAVKTPITRRSHWCWLAEIHWMRMEMKMLVCINWLYYDIHDHWSWRWCWFCIFLWTNLAIFGDDDVGMAMVISLNLCGFKILNALSVKISIS